MKWFIIENIIILIVVGVLFYLTRSPWVFLLLLFLNLFRKKKAR